MPQFKYDRKDQPVRVSNNEVIYDEDLWSLGLFYNSQVAINFLNINPVNPRIIPYREKFQFMVTYEVETNTKSIQRAELNFFAWLSLMGGFWTFFSLILNAIDFFDDVELFIVSDLLSNEKEYVKEHVEETLQRDNTIDVD